MAHLIPIKDGRLHFGTDLATVAAALHAGAAVRDGVTMPPLTEVAADHPVLARLHRNQWIADCPDCKGTQFVWLDEPLFLCVSCWNAMAGGAWRPIVLPQNRAEIERVMLARPLPHNRNWGEDPDMSMDDYRAENVAHGFPAEAEV